MYELCTKHWTTLKKLIYLRAAVGGGTEEYTGDIVQFETARSKKLKNLIINLSPIQDLNGYDAPWPAGGGVNLADASDVSIQADTYKTYAVASGISLKAGTYTLSWTLSKTVTAVRNRPEYAIGGSYTIAPSDYLTAGRSSWTFTLAEDATILLYWWGHTVSDDCTVSDFMLEVGSSPTAFAPYENLCPILGRASTSAWRTGKNLFDPNSISKEWVTYNGTITTSSNAKTNRIQAKFGDVFTLSNANASSGENTLLIAFIDADGSVIGSRYIETGGATYITATAPENTAEAIVGFFYWTKSDKQQLELGSTATDYEAFQGNLFSVEFPALGKNLFNVKNATPYNQNVTLTFNADGSMECQNGNGYAVSPFANYPIELPAGTYTISSPSFPDRNITIYASDNGTDWAWYANGLTSSVKVRTFTCDKKYIRLNWQVSANETATLPPVQIEAGSVQSPVYEPYTNMVYSGTVDIVTGELRVRPEYSSYNGETLLGEWMSSMDKYVAGTTPTTGAQVVDLGGTETIYHLTPQQVMSLVGHNVVFSPDGSVTVRV